ncbi:MAG: hypothetical protein FJ246_12090, partial [Nitrospira sp.]|nr:hypothetical protein [Nitrospira sp.]
MASSQTVPVTAFKAEQVKWLYRNLGAALLGGGLVATILTVALWPVASHVLLGGWLAGILAVSLARFAVARRYWAAQPLSQDCEVWENRHLAGVAVAGIVWGSAGLLLFSKESIEHQVLVAFALGGCAAGAIATLAIRLEAWLLFAVPTMLPLTLRFFYHGGETSLAMGGMMTAFVVLLTVTARTTRDTLIASLTLRLEKQDLIADLTASKERVEHLNEVLVKDLALRAETEKELR